MANVLSYIIGAKDNTAGAINSASSRIGSFMGTLTLLNQATQFIGRAFDKIKQIGMSFIAPFAEAERVVTRLSAALQLTGESSTDTVENLKAYANSLQKITVYDDEAILGSMAFAKSMGLATKDLKQATVAAMGLASAYGMDLRTAMMLITRASFGQTQMLRRYGIIIENSLSPQQKFNALLKIGAERFGIVRQEANTLAGAMTMVKNRWDEVKESMGERIARGLGLEGIFKGVLTALEKLDDWVANNTAIQNFFAMIKDAAANAAAIITTITAGGPKATETIGAVTDIVKDAFAWAGGAVKNLLIEGFEKGQELMIEAFDAGVQLLEESPMGKKIVDAIDKALKMLPGQGGPAATAAAKILTGAALGKAFGTAGAVTGATIAGGKELMSSGRALKLAEEKVTREDYGGSWWKRTMAGKTADAKVQKYWNMARQGIDINAPAAETMTPEDIAIQKSNIKAELKAKREAAQKARTNALKADVKRLTDVIAPAKAEVLRIVDPTERERKAYTDAQEKVRVAEAVLTRDNTQQRSPRAVAAYKRAKKAEQDAWETYLIAINRQRIDDIVSDTTMSDQEKARQLQIHDARIKTIQAGPMLSDPLRTMSQAARDKQIAAQRSIKDAIESNLKMTPGDKRKAIDAADAIIRRMGGNPDAKAEAQKKVAAAESEKEKEKKVQAGLKRDLEEEETIVKTEKEKQAAMRQQLMTPGGIRAAKDAEKAAAKEEEKFRRQLRHAQNIDNRSTTRMMGHNENLIRRLGTDNGKIEGRIGGGIGKGLGGKLSQRDRVALEVLESRKKEKAAAEAALALKAKMEKAMDVVINNVGPALE